MGAAFENLRARRRRLSSGSKDAGRPSQTTNRPTTSPSGTGPYRRASTDAPRFSPRTKIVPSGTAIGPTCAPSTPERSSPGSRLRHAVEDQCAVLERQVGAGHGERPAWRRGARRWVPGPRRARPGMAFGSGSSPCRAGPGPLPATSASCCWEATRIGSAATTQIRTRRTSTIAGHHVDSSRRVGVRRSLPHGTAPEVRDL